MSQLNFDDTLNTCLDLIQQGASIEECLDRFPSVSAELRPILELTVQMNMIEFTPPSIPAFREGRNRLRATVQTKKNKEAKRANPSLPIFAMLPPNKSATAKRGSSIFQMGELKLWIEDVIELSGIRQTNVLRPVLASLIIVCSLFFSVNASANSLPGDLLYPVKTLSQQARIRMASSANKSAVIEEVTAKRVEELDLALSDSGREATVTLNGVATRISNDTILVDGLEILVTSETVQQADLVDGNIVEIEVQLKNSTLSALSIGETPAETEPVADEDEDEQDDGDDPSDNPISSPNDEAGDSESNPNAGPENNNSGNSNNPNAGPENNNSGNSNNPNAGPGNNNSGNSNNPNSNSGNQNNDQDENSGPSNSNNPNAGPGNNNSDKEKNSNSGSGNNSSGNSNNPNAGPGNSNNNGNGNGNGNGNNNESGSDGNNGRNDKDKKDKNDKD